MKTFAQMGGKRFRRRVPSHAIRVLWLAAALGVWGGQCAAQAPAEAAPAAAVSVDALSRAREQVQKFFDRFSNVACTESLTQWLLGKNGKPFYRENSVYDYQFQVSTENGALSFSEARDVRSPAFRDPGRSLLLTSGFASMLLVVHPMYEASYTFTPEGEERVGTARLAKVRFTAVPGATSPAALRLRGRNYPLPLSGVLWIDPDTGAVVKLQAQVDASLSDLGLAGMKSEIQYAAHQFHNPDETVWIPESAMIDVETPRQHWRNLHRFTNYKRFDVNVHQVIDPAQ